MKPKKSYTRMSTRELAEATKGLSDVTFEDTRPLRPENRRWWNQAKRSRSGRRPGVGNGARPVLIRVDRRLLERADRFADRQGISRSELFARGLKAVLAGRAGTASNRGKIAG